MVNRTHYLTSAAVLLLSLGVVLQASGVDRAIADTEARRRGAESSLRELMAKPEANLDQARKAYASAAAGQNAWLDLIIQAVEQKATTAPDITAASEAAAASLMEWVNVGGAALGLPPVTASFAKGLQQTVTHDLIDIGNATWKGYQNADIRKQADALTSLDSRLRWKSVEDIR